MSKSESFRPNKYPIAARPLTTALTRARTGLIEQIRQRPVRSLAVAVGAGYLMGGGLATKLTGGVLAVTGRFALRLAVVPLFLAAMERNLFGDRSSDET